MYLIPTASLIISAHNILALFNKKLPQKFSLEGDVSTALSEFLYHLDVNNIDTDFFYHVYNNNGKEKLYEDDYEEEENNEEEEDVD